jgi:predicted RNase H-like nuclease (RuvC/YqgF family)
MKWRVFGMLVLLCLFCFCSPPAAISQELEAAQMIAELESILLSYEAHTAKLHQSLKSQDEKLTSLLEKSADLERDLNAALRRAESSEIRSRELRRTISRLESALADSQKLTEDLERSLKKQRWLRIRDALGALGAGLAVGALFL